MEVQKKFVADPLTFLAVAMQVFGIANSLKLLGKPFKNVRKALVEAYRKNSCAKDIELFVNHDVRHEIYNELNKDEIIAESIEWTNSRIS